MERRRITIFDTTLRDGEQSPGIALQPAQKAEIAEQLERLGVDVIEAGFPASSPGDFEGVREVARTVEGPTVAALARTRKEDVDAAVEAVAARGARASTSSSRRARCTWSVSSASSRRKSSSRCAGRSATPPGAQTRCSSRPRTLTRSDPAFLAGVPRGNPGRRDDDQPARHGRLLAARRARRVPARRSASALPGARGRLRLACTATTTSAWRSPTRSPVSRRGHAGRVHRERHRRARRQRGARGDRHGAPRARAAFGAETGVVVREIGRSSALVSRS